MNFKIGIMTSCLALPAREAIKTAAQLGAQGIQLFTTTGELDPRALDKSARDDLRSLVASLGLELASLCADFGGHGFADADGLEERIQRTNEVVDLAVDLGTNVVTTHIGVVPEDQGNPAWRIMGQALERVGAYAEDCGCVLATETGPESPDLLRRFLGTLSTRGIAVNYDPANLVMAGFDHLSGVPALADYIVHTHAKDGLRSPQGPREVPLGEGQVNFPEYLRRLEQAGYQGFLTIEREAGEDRVGDIGRAVTYLQGLLAG